MLGKAAASWLRSTLGAGNRLLQTQFPVTIFVNKDSASLTAAVVVKKVSRDDYLYTEVNRRGR